MKKTISIILVVYLLVFFLINKYEENINYNYEQNRTIVDIGKKDGPAIIQVTHANFNEISEENLKEDSDEIPEESSKEISSEIPDTKNNEISEKSKENINSSKNVSENSKEISSEISDVKNNEISEKSKENTNSSKNVSENSKVEESSVIKKNDMETYKNIPESKILNVKNIQQLPEYEAGCEITSTTILLNYYGFKIKKTELINYLPTKPYYFKDGMMYCGDPNEEFCGAVASNAYGCFSGAIMKTIKSYFSDINEKMYFPVESKNTKPEKLYYEISQGKPVIVWATTFMREPFDGESWIIEGTNKTFTWPTREHCLVLIGYTKDEVVLSDPYDSLGTVRYSKDLFEERFKEMGGQAIVLEKNKK